MSPARTIVLVADSPSEIRSRLASAGRVLEVAPHDLDEGAREDLETADCAVVSASTNAAATSIRRLHALAPALQVVLVTTAEQRRQVERALLFAPGLGEVWLAEAEELDAEIIERASGVTRQRRRYRVTRRQIEDDLSAVEPQRGRRALISDAYLAALLQVLPAPVLSIDEHDRILSWNPAAERFFGLSSSEAVGRTALDALAPVDRSELARALAEGGHTVHRIEASFDPPGTGLRVAEVTVAPVSAAGHRVRSVVLHDVTGIRRTQDALEQRTEELAGQRARLEEQTAELAHLNRDLQQRSAELENALAARSRFYASMSHELRTPMNAIIGYNSLLLDGVYGELEANQKTAVGKSQRAAEHLLELVNDVLDLAKIEAGRIELLVEPTRFPGALADLLDTLGPMARERGSELRLQEGEGEHSVITDPRRLRQILLNLLSNAIKFGEGKPVEIGWRALPDGGVRIDVTDHGCGIAAEDVARIFDEFVQLQDRGAGGTGLGLAISRRLAGVLGGELEVRSEPGDGSTFCLTLPADLPPDAPRSEPEEEGDASANGERPGG